MHLLKIAAEIIGVIIIVIGVLIMVGLLLLAKDKANGNNPFE